MTPRPDDDALSLGSDIVELSALEVRCVVGVYAHERPRAQPLVVRARLHLDLRRAGASDDVVDTVDYALLTGQIRFLLESARFRLIESAADVVARWILLPPTPDAPRPAVARAVVRIDKPEALRSLAQPAVVVARDADEAVVATERAPWGTVEVLHRSRGIEIARLRLAPGAEVSTHAHDAGEESELTVGSGLVAQARPVPWSTALTWPPGHPHGWRNSSTTEQTLVRVRRGTSADRAADAPGGGLVMPPTVDYAPAGTRDAVAER